MMPCKIKSIMVKMSALTRSVAPVTRNCVPAVSDIPGRVLSTHLQRVGGYQHGPCVFCRLAVLREVSPQAQEHTQPVLYRRNNTLCNTPPFAVLSWMTLCLEDVMTSAAGAAEGVERQRVVYLTPGRAAIRHLPLLPPSSSASLYVPQCSSPGARLPSSRLGPRPARLAQARLGWRRRAGLAPSRSACVRTARSHLIPLCLLGVPKPRQSVRAGHPAKPSCSSP